MIYLTICVSNTLCLIFQETFARDVYNDENFIVYDSIDNSDN